MPLETVHKPFGQLYFAAKRLAALSERAAESRRQRENEIALAQSATLLLVFALEALINLVIAELGPTSETQKRRMMGLSLTKKFARVPLLWGGKVPYDRAREPFKTFEEMVLIRHSWVHPQPKSMPLDEFRSKDDDPIPPHHQLRIPQLPQDLRCWHARKAVETADQLLEWLKSESSARINTTLLYGSAITERPAKASRRKGKP